MEIIIHTKSDMSRALYLIEEAPLLPVRVVTIAEYVIDRSLAQNRLAFRWYNDAADQLKDGTASDKRAYCKLHFGVAILKDGTGKSAEKFRDVYDRIIRPLTYEQKLELMTDPINLPITSLMTVKQFTQYLDSVQQFFSSIGVVLVTDDDLFNTAMGRKKP
jgi:hypothetical protein